MLKQNFSFLLSVIRCHHDEPEESLFYDRNLMVTRLPDRCYIQELGDMWVDLTFHAKIKRKNVHEENEVYSSLHCDIILMKIINIFNCTTLMRTLLEAYVLIFPIDRHTKTARCLNKD